MIRHPAASGQRPAATEPILRAERLVVRRAERMVLDVPELAVQRGEVVAVIGPNGAGKSTLLQTLALLLKPTSGRLWFDGEMVDDRADRVALRRRMAVVFQEPLLLDMSVYDNVALGLRLRGVPSAEHKGRVFDWLSRFGIPALVGRQARALSGGEAQRVSLARAFTLAPDILFLDEPFAALDAPTRAEMTDQVGAMLRETAMTALVVTHDRNEALALGDRIGVMIGGRLRQLGPGGEVFSAPVDPDVAAFVGVETVVAGRVVGWQGGLAQVQVGRHVVEVVSEIEAGADTLVCLRPEDVTLFTHAGEAASSARNHLPGQVVRVRPAGAQVRVTIDCGFPLVALVTTRSAQALDLTPGRPVTAAFKASAVHLIRRREPHNIPSH